MAGPAWLAGVLAAAMILTAGYAASRLATARVRPVATEADADGLHVLMGTAMAGMFLPQLNLLPSTVWTVMFGIGAAWFASRAIRARRAATPRWQCQTPVPHLIECVAMLYMLWSVPAVQHGSAMVMPGMGASPAVTAGFPAFAVVLALFMLGYLLWTTDQLASLARASTSAPAPARGPEQRALVTVRSAASRPASLGRPAGTPPASAAPLPQPATGRPLLAPKLAACSKMAMSIAMGYMLVTLL